MSLKTLTVIEIPNGENSDFDRRRASALSRTQVLRPRETVRALRITVRCAMRGRLVSF